jgi:Domain of unknown function (DUF397)
MGNWRKSTYSGANGGDCIEVGSDGYIMVRDSADRDGVALALTSEAWLCFMASLR